MQFNSFSDFISMGGYGFYVWLSFGSCALILLGIFLDSKLSHQRTLNAVSKQLEREARIKKAKQESK
ncbi:heme exporter protein CcmD [Pseudoalteromonas denitrificans]|uniref:Heme exporter protein D n=1 Tax=Pseudoalteromonas denitrificans DSM 6059 TaxID=1123010 RepID=A0A1I1HL59_9GAMM|nr:heme exporter protein CcmD [Pseudoalteromonas denitrificans]SFC22698.1 heme exporter protein D [Pseudoalteromonas denitrificans DSM 6059]